MKRNLIRKALWTLVILCFSSGYVVSIEGGDVSVTITNGTKHYLHVVINNQPFLYVGPGGVAHTETPLSTAFVEAIYSPGQGISGKAEKELTSTTTYKDTWTNTCHNSNSNDCTVNESDASSVTRTPMSWTVTPADMTADTTSTSH